MKVNYGSLPGLHSHNRQFMRRAQSSPWPAAHALRARHKSPARCLAKKAGTIAFGPFIPVKKIDASSISIIHIGITGYKGLALGVPGKSIR
jgi:hypothetical protein